MFNLLALFVPLGQYCRLLIESSQCNTPSDAVQLSHISVSTVLSHWALFIGVYALNCCLGGYMRPVFPRELLIPIISSFIASVKSRLVWRRNMTVSTPFAGNEADVCYLSPHLHCDLCHSQLNQCNQDFTAPQRWRCHSCSQHVRSLIKLNRNLTYIHLPHEK